MRDYFLIYFNYSIIINIFIGIIVGIFSGYISHLFTDDQSYGKLLYCVRWFVIYFPLFQLRVFLGTYLRSNDINRYTFIVSGLLYPLLVAITLFITYLFYWFNIKVLLFSVIFCDFIIVILLVIKTELNI